MQFNRDGLNIPDELVRRQKQGNVVFLCGAGVGSYPRASIDNMAKTTYHISVNQDIRTKFKLFGADNKDILEDVEEPNKRLQALIAEWLRMENLVVLTGAGASICEGGKEMKCLEKAVIAKLKGKECFQPLIEKRNSDLGFEDWISHLVAGHSLISKSQSLFNTVIAAGDLKSAIKSIEGSILKECVLILDEKSDELSSHAQFLAKLITRDSNLGRTHLFTLNYDTLFEQACESIGIQYFDGFAGRANARFYPSVYGLDIYYPGEVAEGRVRRFDKFLHLYKLHGSIHWHINKDEELRARHPDLYQLKKDLESDNADDNIEPVAILPTIDKLNQTLMSPFAHLFRSFHNRLSVPQTFLLVVGYGFGDEHVNKIIEQGLTNPSLVMLVVEPRQDSETAEKVMKLIKMREQVFLLTGATFENLSDEILPNVRWLEVFQKMRTYEKKIQQERKSE